jgi:hypothetical protein
MADTSGVSGHRVGEGGGSNGWQLEVCEEEAGWVAASGLSADQAGRR